MNQNQLDQKRKWVTGKFIVGIDPAKDKHQATIIDDNGNVVGKSLSLAPYEDKSRKPLEDTVFGCYPIRPLSNNTSI